ncbi:MAG: deoxyuridine 5'-triphosphate nucleotidohydrolase [Candidatus Jordarchaeum sp.]|uniref:deoxyuridine 5'-triphosphate nucleotidohydrolase n=1 Tax=Candidatus Jordarchaeum sp. TaxID=2823881 RepID=UPI004049C69E
MGSVLSGKNIREMILRGKLVREYIDLDKQLTPNGFDLSLREVHTFKEQGYVDFSNKNRRVSETGPLDFNHKLHLEPGAYKIIYNEVVDLPNNILAIGRTRSTLLRCGVSVVSAVFDAGYVGRCESLLVVSNPHGFVMEKNARVLQLIFLKLSAISEGYTGVYKGENI